MSYYPVIIDLKDRKVLVVGGGSVAVRKVETLLRNSARVSLVALKLNPLLQKYVDEGRVEYLGTGFDEKYIRDVFMVIAATDDSRLNHRISMAAEAKNILVNAVDQPEDCNFIVPSVVKRGDLIIAVSTSGKSPAYAREIRKRLSREFGREHECFLKMMGRIRKEVISRGYGHNANSIIFNRIVTSSILELIKAEDWQGVSDLLSNILQREVTVDDVKNYIGD